MDKNVSSVDLEELMKARQELDAEKGVETDPSMYADYNPDRVQETQNVELQNSSEMEEHKPYDEINSEQTSANVESQTESVTSSEDIASSENALSDTATVAETQEKDMSMYDMFSAFEIPGGETIEETKTQITEEIVEETNEKPEGKDEAEATKTVSLDNHEVIEQKLDEVIEEIVNFVNEIDDDPDESDELAEEQPEIQTEVKMQEEVAEHQEVAVEPTTEEIRVEETQKEEFIQTENTANEPDETSINLAQEVSEITEKPSTETKQEETVNVPSEESVKEDEVKSETKDIFAKVAEISASLEDETQEEKKEEPKTTEQNQNVVIENSATEEEVPQAEIITDYSKLKDMLQQELEEADVAEADKIEEIEKDIKDANKINFKPIDECKFVELIANDEFKNSNKLSFIIGKAEDGETVYGNFAEHYNFAVFGDEEQYTNELLNSVVLSLSLKNTVKDVNFVICDPKADTTFEVYNDSSYMFFNRVAKTNKEILDTLIEVTKELDGRYNKLAAFGVKSVDTYNDQALMAGIPTIPKIVVIFNNYTKSAQITDSDKINACLYQILKYGRMVGIYVMLEARAPIENNDVNYNLPSRVALKSEEDSAFTLGESGSTDLQNFEEALFLSISNEKVLHVRVPSITSTEIELLIKNLED